MASVKYRALYYWEFVKDRTQYYHYSLINWMSESPGKETAAEFLATFFFISCGLGVTACRFLNTPNANLAVSSAFGWGLALSASYSAVYGISGAHLNPAVTLALATLQRFPWDKVPYFMAAQYAGSFMATVVVYFSFIDGIMEFSDDEKLTPPARGSTAQIFSTYPDEWISDGTGLGCEILGAALLLVIYSAVKDRKFPLYLNHSQAVIVGAGLAIILMMFGDNNEVALNPARDFAPRLFTAMSGWGFSVFSFREFKWFWCPVVGPYLGAVLGAWCYYIIVDLPHETYERFLAEKKEAEENIAREQKLLEQRQKEELEAKQAQDKGNEPGTSKDTSSGPKKRRRNKYELNTRITYDLEKQEELEEYVARGELPDWYTPDWRPFPDVKLLD